MKAVLFDTIGSRRERKVVCESASKGILCKLQRIATKVFSQYRVSCHSNYSNFKTTAIGIQAFKTDTNRMAWRTSLLTFFLAAVCIYSCDAIANEINQNDLNQEEESYNDDLVNAIFHSNFWTSREMKVMTKYISLSVLVMGTGRIRTDRKMSCKRKEYLRHVKNLGT